MIRRFLRTLITYALSFIISLVGFALVIPLALLPAPYRLDNKIYFAICSYWSRLLFFIGGVRLRIKGKFDHEKSYVIIANHQSALDIPAIEVLLKSRPRVWMSKVTFGRVPLLGVLLKRMHVLIDKRSPRQAVRALFEAIARSQEGKRDLILFPEGGRFNDGKIHPFYSGFVTLVRKLDRPVLPVYIEKAGKVLAKGDFLIKNSETIFLTVGPRFEKNRDEDETQFKERVHAWFVAQQEQRQ